MIIDTKAIYDNARKLIKDCSQRGIQVVGVTKMFCGNIKIARVLKEAGVDIIADSRIENLRKLAKLDIPKMLIRLPMYTQAKQVVKYADISLVSDYKVIKELSRQAVIQGKIHEIILMIDLGDLREGLMNEEEIHEMTESILSLKGVKLKGVGTNLSCFGGVYPSCENLSKLVEIKNRLNKSFSIDLEVVSGGNSGSLSLFKDNKLPKGINQLRLGVSIALGIGLDDEPIDDLSNDTVRLLTEIIEIREKPSVPIGNCGLDAFGNKQTFEDRGIRKRAICAIGRQDVAPENLVVLDEDVTILGASSDHLLIDITDSKRSYNTGDIIEFGLSYGGCLSSMTSSYIRKKFI